MRPRTSRQRGRRRRAKPLIEVIVRSPRWRARRRAAAVLRRAISAAAEAASTPRAELAIVLADDSGIRALNREWRKRDAATDVLSFPAPPVRVPRRMLRRFGAHLGDIVIAYETTAREAAAEGKPFDHHLAHLAVHGYLHLLGYDHATVRDAARMERLETEILARLGVPDPYRARPRTQ